MLALVSDTLARAFAANSVLRGTRLCLFADHVAMVLWRLAPQRPSHEDIPIIHLGGVRRRCLGGGWGGMPEAPAQTPPALLDVRFFDEGRHSGAQLGAVLIHRARQWNEDNPEALLGSWTEWVHTGPPPVLIVGVAYTALHAASTTHRFGLELFACPLGCGAEAGEW